MKRKVVSGAILSLLARASSIAAGFLIIALVTRILSQSQVGIYFLVQSVVLVIVPLGNLSLQQPMIAAIAAATSTGDNERATALARSSILLTLLASLVVSGTGVIGWVVAWFIGYSGDAAQWPVLLLMAAWIIVLALESQLVGILQGLNKIGMAVTYDGTLGKVLSMVALLAMYFGPGDNDLTQILSVLVGCEFLAVIAAMISTQNVIGILRMAAPSVPRAELITMAWPFLLQQLIASVISQSSVLVLALFVSPMEVAIYATASRLAGLLALPATILNVPLAPIVARLHVQNRHREIQSLLQSASIVPTVIAVAGISCMAIFGDTILASTFGGTYADGRNVLLILSAGHCVNLYFGPSLLGLAMTGHQRTVTQITVLAGVAQVAVMLVVVRQFGLIGIAISAVIEPCMIKGLGGVAAFRILNIRTHFPVCSLLRYLRKLGSFPTGKGNGH